MNYIEISPRATGKTFRLIKAVKTYLKRFPKNKAYIFTYSERGAKRLSEKINNTRAICASYQTLFSQGHSRTGTKNTRRFFEEFDYYILSELHLKVRKSDYFVTSPARIRTKADFKKNDFLLALLKRNNWVYTSVNPVELLAEILGKEKASAFPVDFSNKFFEF